MINQLFWERFLKMPVIGIVRNMDYEDLKQVLPLFCDTGLNSIEITMNSAHCEEQIRLVANKYGDKINVGAGTVYNKSDLYRALAAGAQFIVTPFVNMEVVRECTKRKLPVFCGAFTLTEIYQAWTAGADMIKVFPSTLGGSQYIKDIRGPLDKVKLLPTGGVSVDNCIDFLEAGAEGLGMGSQLFDKTYIKNKAWEALRQHFENIVEKIETYKRG